MRSMEQGGAGLDLSGIQAEVDRLTRVLPEGADGAGGERPQLAMCHNDLHQGNMLLVEENNKVEFIDFEYAGLNYVAYDIANHFWYATGVVSLYPSLRYYFLPITCSIPRAILQ